MLRERIASALEDAKESDNHLRCCMLRLIQTAFRDRELALSGEDGSRGLDETEMIALLLRMVEQREKSVADYEQSGQMELAEREREEIDIIREFLPRPLSGTECDKAIRGAIAETHASSIRDMGKVMSVLRKRYPGRLDFCDANARVKAALG